MTAKCKRKIFNCHTTEWLNSTEARRRDCASFRIRVSVGFRVSVVGSLLTNEEALNDKIRAQEVPFGGQHRDAQPLNGHQ